MYEVLIVARPKMIERYKEALAGSEGAWLRDYAAFSFVSEFEKAWKILEKKDCFQAIVLAGCLDGRSSVSPETIELCAIAERAGVEIRIAASPEPAFQHQLERSQCSHQVKEGKSFCIYNDTLSLLEELLKKKEKGSD